MSWRPQDLSLLIGVGEGDGCGGWLLHNTPSSNAGCQLPALPPTPASLNPQPSTHSFAKGRLLAAGGNTGYRLCECSCAERCS